VVVLDPPRSGLGRGPMAALCKVAAERVVYVSCDPATLARDLEVAADAGFDLSRVAVFDLMPMTAEVEVVATLTRRRRGR
jgi:23S rRNA (uracil1939-C5)-methyltransferase